MSDPATPATAAVVASTPVKSGFLSSELWVKVLVLGLLVALVEKLPDLAQQIASVPNLPPLVGVVLGIVPLVVGVAGPLLSKYYTDSRTALKLAQTPPASPDAAAKVLS